MVLNVGEISALQYGTGNFLVLILTESVVLQGSVAATLACRATLWLLHSDDFEHAFEPLGWRLKLMVTLVGHVVHRGTATSVPSSRDNWKNLEQHSETKTITISSSFEASLKISLNYSKCLSKSLQVSELVPQTPWISLQTSKPLCPSCVGAEFFGKGMRRSRNQ